MKRLVKKKMIPLAKGFWYIAGRDLLLLLLLLAWGVSEVSGANGAVGDTFNYQGNTYKITEVYTWTQCCELTSSDVPNTEPLIVPDYAYNSDTGLEYQVVSIAANSCRNYRGLR